MRFVDIDPATWNLDTAAAAAAVGAADEGVVRGLLRRPAGRPRAAATASRGDVVVIEDGCHALGGHRDGAMVGGPGGADITCFSLHPVKSMTTGEGGLATHRGRRARRAPAPLPHARHRARARVARRRPTAPGTWRCRSSASTTGSPTSSARSGSRSSGGSTAGSTRRNEIAARYRELLADEERHRRCRPRRRRARCTATTCSSIRVRAGAQARLRASSRGCAPPASASRCTTSRSTACPYYRDTLGVAAGRLPATPRTTTPARSRCRCSRR